MESALYEKHFTIIQNEGVFSNSQVQVMCLLSVLVSCKKKEKKKERKKKKRRKEDGTRKRGLYIMQNMKLIFEMPGVSSFDRKKNST